MGRSLAPVAETEYGQPTHATTGLPIEAKGVTYTIEHRDGHVFHKAARRGADGTLFAEIEAEVKYALGSGTRGISFLIDRDGFLSLSPTAWFSQLRRWDISPGYGEFNSQLNFERRNPARLSLLPYQPVQPGSRDAEPLRRADFPGPYHRVRALPRARRAPRETGRALGRARFHHCQPRESAAGVRGIGLSAVPSPGYVPLRTRRPWTA